MTTSGTTHSSGLHAIMIGAKMSKEIRPYLGRPVKVTISFNQLADAALSASRKRGKK
jgi:hypothetical protein